jgi:hypothetical protein
MTNPFITTLSVFLLGFSGLPLISSEASNISEASAAQSSNVRNFKEENSEFIPWVTRRNLEWEDFQSAPKRNTEAVASTSTSLGLSYQVSRGQLSYEVTCNFSKLKSWGLVKTDYILAHEQGHFDITELFARKLHESLSKYQFNKRTYKDDINRIYNSVVKEKEEMQNAYDGETDHSRKRRFQREWAEAIEKMLEQSAPYANYP